MSVPPYSQTRPNRRLAMARAPRNVAGSAALALAVVGMLLAWNPSTAMLAVGCGAAAVLTGFVACVRISRGLATNRVATLAGVLLGVGATTVGVWCLWVSGRIADHPTTPRHISGIPEDAFTAGTYLRAGVPS